MDMRLSPRVVYDLDALSAASAAAAPSASAGAAVGGTTSTRARATPTPTLPTECSTCLWNDDELRCFHILPVAFSLAICYCILTDYSTLKRLLIKLVLDTIN